jgi:hypothetical protein
MGNGHRFAVWALIAVSTSFLAGSAFAQGGFGTHTFGGATIHGTPPSVTSIGFGGHPGFHGIPPSVTSLNFGNVPGRRDFGFRGDRFGRDGFGRRHHRRDDDDFLFPLVGGYYLPYGYDYGYDDPSNYGFDPGVDDSMEQNYYRTGPTVFDRNGAGRMPGPPPGYDYRTELNPPPAREAAPVADQPDTVLVFKDGHEQEVKNYAIVGATLYDLSDGRTRKVQLAELDLTATVKQNDDRGIAFQLPAGSKLN